MFSREMNPGLGRSGRVRPQLEALEDRCCPSGVSLHNHILTLTGDATNSTIIVRDGGHGNISAQIEDGHGVNGTAFRPTASTQSTSTPTAATTELNTISPPINLI